MCFLGHGLGAIKVLRQVPHVDSSPLLVWERSSRRPSGGGGGGSTRRLGALPPFARFSNARPHLDRGFLSDLPAEADEETIPQRESRRPPQDTAAARAQSGTPGRSGGSGPPPRPDTQPAARSPAGDGSKRLRSVMLTTRVC